MNTKLEATLLGDAFGVVGLFKTSLFQVKEETTAKGMISRLVLRKSRRQDTSVFHCLAENKFGKSQRTISLVVQVSPILNK